MQFATIVASIFLVLPLLVVAVPVDANAAIAVPRDTDIQGRKRDPCTVCESRCADICEQVSNYSECYHGCFQANCLKKGVCY